MRSKIRSSGCPATTAGHIKLGKSIIAAWAICILAFPAGSSRGETAHAGIASVRIDACALLHASEISHVIGLRVGTGVREDAGVQADGSYSSSCVWIIELKQGAAIDPAGPLGGRSFVILNSFRWPAGSHLAGSYLDSFRRAAANGDIPGKTRPRPLGDEALSWGDGLAVRVGDVSFGVSVFIPGLGAASADRFEEQFAQRTLRQLRRQKS
jgi:hypothetical protein